jgi:DNA-binding HxlR family transcriptional regulator
MNHRPDRNPAEHDALVIAYDVFDRNCPSRATLDHVTGRWGVLALAALLDGSQRFNALRRHIDGVSEKMLSQSLRALERDGLVERTQSSVMPPVVHYELTPLGRDAAEQAVGQLRWLEAHMSQIIDAQRRHDRTGARGAPSATPSEETMASHPPDERR